MFIKKYGTHTGGGLTIPDTFNEMVERIKTEGEYRKSMVELDGLTAEDIISLSEWINSRKER